ncbi:26S proteasome non-ATPase regulatory subunit 9 [Cyphellophora attinorum]|uniref:Probable 26S proteasome regulatory subunit p27 n=1 Tax=Cyphellophora attinorum TaxID=1664694 RepID=A0A0N1HTT6_9EURO|nr:26S proteasome non-ATPase regulatory subunit 9 [Phialophora attinorum]KPI42572.1 26S proteasome non-ATPase regulatory subunit 9 [Phialophora attinorum]
MGRPMNLNMQSDDNLSSIHVPSGPTSTSYNAASLDNLSLHQLITRKDNLEAELKALGSVLDSHGVNMQTPLIDADGFPRADIDVPQIRVTRARIIEMRNDWKALMSRIEKGLHEHHAELQKGGVNGTTASAEEEAAPATNTQLPVRTQDTPASEVPDVPFAKVRSVEPGSPANEAGLKPGDKIRRFGRAIWSNHEGLRVVGEVVQGSTGRPIPVRVVREVLGGAGELDMELRLTPRQGWGGRGSLGCHIVPI